MRRFPAAANALIWSLMGFGAGTILMLWIFNGS
jgi:hypothetical protein